jgi:dCTP deaminase
LANESFKAKTKECILCGTEIPLNDVVCSSCGFYQNERLLVDWEIRKMIEKDVIVIDPILDIGSQLGPATLDIRLDGIFREFRYMDTGMIDLTEEIGEHRLYDMKELEIEKNQHYFLQPGSFVLGQSLEYIKLPSFVSAQVGGRSRLAKLGIEIHATANVIHPGFAGHLTFELKNQSNMGVELRPLGRIASVAFYVTQRAEKPYSGSSQYQTRIKPAKPDDDLQRIAEFFKEHS